MEEQDLYIVQVPTYIITPRGLACRGLYISNPLQIIVYYIWAHGRTGSVQVPTYIITPRGIAGVFAFHIPCSRPGDQQGSKWPLNCVQSNPLLAMSSRVDQRCDLKIMHSQSTHWRRVLSECYSMQYITYRWVSNRQKRLATCNLQSTWSDAWWRKEHMAGHTTNCKQNSRARTSKNKIYQIDDDCVFPHERPWLFKLS